jgi:hypothetical protein
MWLFNPRIGFPLLAVTLMIVSFFGGIAYQKTKVSNNPTPNLSQTNAQFGGMGGPMGLSQGNRAFGTVSSISDSSITVSDRDGSTTTYTITSSTQVTDNGSTASISDIQTGDTAILELSSSDSKQVTSIVLNPSFNGGGPTTSTNSSSSSSSI